VHGYTIAGANVAGPHRGHDDFPVDDKIVKAADDMGANDIDVEESAVDQGFHVIPGLAGLKGEEEVTAHAVLESDRSRRFGKGEEDQVVAWFALALELLDTDASSGVRRLGSSELDDLVDDAALVEVHVDVIEPGRAGFVVV